MAEKHIKDKELFVVVIALIRGLKFTVALLEKVLRGEAAKEKP